MARRSPGGVGDGLPAMPDGEPLLARWFVIGMLVLVLVGLVLVVLVGLSIRTTDLAAAARRPPGTATVTHDRGAAVLAEDRTEVVAESSCAPRVRVVGDEGARATLLRALSASCQLVARDEDGLALAAAGLDALDAGRGVLRVAVFEVNGLDSSTRVEDGVTVVELNNKFQFDDATLAAPFLLHELAHLGADFPGAAVDVDAELAALQVQARACDLLVLPEDPPRGCNDAAEVLAEPDPRAALRDAGYPG